MQGLAEQEARFQPFVDEFERLELGAALGVLFSESDDDMFDDDFDDVTGGDATGGDMTGGDMTGGDMTGGMADDMMAGDLFSGQARGPHRLRPFGPRSLDQRVGLAL